MTACTASGGNRWRLRQNACFVRSVVGGPEKRDTGGGPGGSQTEDSGLKRGRSVPRQGEVPARSLFVHSGRSSRWRDEHGEAVQELEGGENEHALAVGAGLGQRLEELLALARPRTKRWFASTARAQ